MNVTLYTKPQCVQCDATQRGLSSRKVEYETVDLTQDADALAKIKKMGYRSAPVVVTEDDHWSGYRPDKIKALGSQSGSGGRNEIGLDTAAPRGRIAL